MISNQILTKSEVFENIFMGGIIWYDTEERARNTLLVPSNAIQHLVIWKDKFCIVYHIVCDTCPLCNENIQGDCRENKDAIPYTLGREREI